MANAEVITLPLPYNAELEAEVLIPEPRNPYEDSVYIERAAEGQRHIEVGPVLTRFVEVLHPEGYYYDVVEEYRVQTA